MVTTIFDVTNETFNKENKVEPKIEAAKKKLTHLGCCVVKVSRGTHQYAVADKQAITAKLEEMNALDMKLYEFAKTLYKALRSGVCFTLRWSRNLQIAVRAMSDCIEVTCLAGQAAMPGANLKRELGIHQTPTHKH
eukprot:765360-Hanusia_phi.AAC.2